MKRRRRIGAVGLGRDTEGLPKCSLPRTIIPGRDSATAPASRRSTAPTRPASKGSGQRRRWHARWQTLGVGLTTPRRSSCASTRSGAKTGLAARKLAVVYELSWRVAQAGARRQPLRAPTHGRLYMLRCRMHGCSTHLPRLRRGGCSQADQRLRATYRSWVWGPMEGVLGSRVSHEKCGPPRD